MLGIVCSMHRQAINRYLNRKEIYLLGLALLFAGLEVGIYGTWGTFHKNPFEVTRIDLQLPQKVIFSLFFMVWLTRYENVKNTAFSALASFSFAIYFLHPFLIRSLEELRPFLHVTIAAGFQLPIVVIAVLVSAMLMALLVRKIFNRSSVLIIGR
jgi:surface polysaccharide O-acyltransferase-like enzyme